MIETETETETETDIKTSSGELPAIAGGSRAKKSPYHRTPRYGEEELKELKEALDQGTLFYAQGKKVKQFEEAFASRSGVSRGVACTSGTAAIHAALIALGIGPGDEVITGPITDVGTVIPILYQGAIPVFADLDPDSYVMDPASIEACITPRTRAILAVHLWGNACDLRALGDLSRRRGLALIEDCAQALGCRYDGRPIGTFGQVGCFSLNEFKHISCGDGGIAITEDEELAFRLRLATDKCYNREPGAAMRQPTFLANNYRMTELQGAVALAQLRKLDDVVRRRKEWCGALSDRLSAVPGISLPRATPGCDPSWWFYMLRVNPGRLGVDATGFAQALSVEGVPAGAHYIGQCVYEYPLFTEHSLYGAGTGDHWQHPFVERRYTKGLCPEAEAILDTAVLISIHEDYSGQDLEETVNAIEKVAAWYSTRGPHCPASATGKS